MSTKSSRSQSARIGAMTRKNRGMTTTDQRRECPKCGASLEQYGIGEGVYEHCTACGYMKMPVGTKAKMNRMTKADVLNEIKKLRQKILTFGDMTDIELNAAFDTAYPESKDGYLTRECLIRSLILNATYRMEVVLNLE